MSVYISICIPAYKRVQYLRRLLDSISSQTFRDFEVIVSDDSNDNSVRDLVRSFSATLPVQYYHNQPAKGTPANWNIAIAKATGTWIKLMHDDDWFADPEGLKQFADRAAANQGKFIFSGYANCYEGSGAREIMQMRASWGTRMLRSPVTLLAHNVVGPPSVTMIHASITEQYDERMKWRVDLDFYIRLLQLEGQYSYIEEVLINVGVNDTQVTNSCINVPAVELPEGYLLVKKYGTQPLKNLLVYDAWWRMFRNMHITSASQLVQFGQKDWPPVLVAMVRHLSRCPRFILRTGITSKFAMFCSWFVNIITSNF